MSNSTALLLLAIFFGLVGWELYYVVHNFGWLPYFYICLFTGSQSLIIKELKPWTR